MTSLCAVIFFFSSFWRSKFKDKVWLIFATARSDWCVKLINKMNSENQKPLLEFVDRYNWIKPPFSISQQQISCKILVKTSQKSQNQLSMTMANLICKSDKNKNFHLTIDSKLYAPYGVLIGINVMNISFTNYGLLHIQVRVH
jgi:hypothetical protein